MDALGKKIEETFNEILSTVKKINGLSQTIDDLKITTNDIIGKYLETIDQTKLEKTKQNSERTLNTMVQDIKRIEGLMSSFEVIKVTLEEQIETFSKRITSLEDQLKKSRGPIQDIDQKLIKYIKEAEKNHETGQKRFTQASQLINATEEIKKYDALLELERDNNKLLRQIISKMNVAPAIKAADNNGNPVLKAKKDFVIGEKNRHDNQKTIKLNGDNLIATVKE